MGFFPKNNSFFSSPMLQTTTIQWFKPTTTEAIQWFKPRATITTNQPKEGVKKNLPEKRWTNKEEEQEHTWTRNHEEDEPRRRSLNHEEHEPPRNRRTIKKKQRTNGVRRSIKCWRGSVRVTHTDESLFIFIVNRWRTFKPLHLGYKLSKQECWMPKATVNHPLNNPLNSVSFLPSCCFFVGLCFHKIYEPFNHYSPLLCSNMW